MNKKALGLIFILIFFPGYLMGAAQANKAEIVDRIVAIVNHEIITLVQLEKAVSPYLAKIQATASSTKRKQEMKESLERKVLHQLIDRTLAQQEAERYQIRVSDSDVDAAIDRFKKKNGLDQEKFEKALEAEGISFQEYQDKIRQDILQSRLINRAVRSKVIITDSDIKAYYEAHSKDFSGVEKYELRNILMSDEKGILEVNKQLAQKASFKLLAEKYSESSNAQEGGYLGVFDINNFNEAIKKELRDLGKGEYTKIIQSDQGFQILFVEDIVRHGGKTFDQAHDEIHTILYKEAEKEKFDKWLESLKENAHVKIML